MTDIYNLSQIKKALETLDPIQAIENGFIAYSQGKAVIPPVGELIFDRPPGGMHIKYGKITNDKYFVVKVATGFQENHLIDLPTGTGLMLVFKQGTGELAAILLDEGHLTNIRTAAAGAVVAKYLAPANIRCIGILGAGIQGRLQLEYLRTVTECKDVMAWGVNREELIRYQHEMESEGYRVRTTLQPEEVADTCNMIITATPATSPLLDGDHIRSGTHITAMGSDTPDKQELDASVLAKADIIVADSISQCLLRGEIFKALGAGSIQKEELRELGNVIADPNLRRTDDDQITIADLTGVAIQDIQIAVAVYERLTEGC